MVKKKDGGWRPCGDYRRLNNVTIPDRYPLPHIADFTSRIAGSTVFSRLDLQKGYYQIPMASEEVSKTAIVKNTEFSKLCLDGLFMQSRQYMRSMKKYLYSSFIHN